MQAKDLDRVFNPRSVAVVGDKKNSDYMWLRSLSTFQGEVYSVQIDPREIPGIEELGYRNYPSLLDVPRPVDYVIIAVPRAVAPKIVADCIKAGVGGATLFTAGFAETNSEEGVRLEREIAEIARQANFPLIGPNCMGIFNPRIGLRQDNTQYSGEGGPAGFIAQSGTHAIFFSLVGEAHGVKISKAVSYGNAAVLDSPDYLEYLANDEETKVVGMYVEGVREGRRFFQCLREAASRKPVVVWKGGNSAEGARATACHTGALASAPILWDAAIRQCGAVKVDSLEEMVDVVKALLYLRPPSGRRAGLIAHSGGQSVVITDAFVQEGLAVPLLDDRSYREFASFFDAIGGSYVNPLDISWNVLSLDDLQRTLDIMSRDENVDFLVLEICMPFLSQIWEYYPPFLDNLLQLLGNFNRTCARCFAIVLVAGQMEAEASALRRRLMDAGVVSFPTFQRAARALRKVLDSRRFERDGM